MNILLSFRIPMTHHRFVKVGMLQRGDSDIGWADLYIIPDRARSHNEKKI